MVRPQLKNMAEELLEDASVLIEGRIKKIESANKNIDKHFYFPKETAHGNGVNKKHKGTESVFTS